MVTLVGVVATLVFTTNGALELPPATGTLTGTVAKEVLLLASETVMPPAGAGAASVTVPCELLPPGTVAGFNVTEARSGFTVRIADCPVALKVPMMVTAVEAPTTAVFTGKFALDDPAGTGMLPCTLATAGLLLVNTTVPPLVVFNVTVPVDEFPPTMLGGFRTTDVMLGVPDCSAPTAVEGSTAANFRSRIPETPEMVFPQDMNPSVPEANAESVVVKTGDPLIANE
jgi:hypothetical protein